MRGLLADGAQAQRLLWASTSTKDPAYRDVMYVEELIGRSTVNTMPIQTLEAFADHGEVRGATLDQGVAEAFDVVKRLTEAQIKLDSVADELEAHGVTLFAQSFTDLLAGLDEKTAGLQESRSA
jgi:transaldolase